MAKGNLLFQGRHAALSRGHLMAGWEHYDRSSTCYCLRCNRWVQVIRKPRPNETEIGGPAVALHCSVKGY